MRSRASYLGIVNVGDYLHHTRPVPQTTRRSRSEMDAKAVRARVELEQNLDSWSVRGGEAWWDRWYPYLRPLALRPVIPNQSFYSGELRDIRRDQGHFVAYGLASDQQAVSTYRPPRRFELRAQFSSHPGIGSLKRQRVKGAGKEHFTSLGVLLLASTLEHSVPELKRYDRRHKKLGAFTGRPRNAFLHEVGRRRHQGNTAVCVEEIIHSNILRVGVAR